MKKLSLAAVAAAALAVTSIVSMAVPAQAFGQHPYHHAVVVHHRMMHHAAIVHHRMMHHAAVVHHRMVHHIMHHG